jgi:hypothetical protein
MDKDCRFLPRLMDQQGVTGDSGSITSPQAMATTEQTRE